MKKQNQYFVEEREIDLKKVLLQVLKKWRLETPLRECT